MGGMGGGMGGMPAAAPAHVTPVANNPAAPAGAQPAPELAPSGMSEEEMLAQAIQASLSQDPNLPESQ